MKKLFLLFVMLCASMVFANSASAKGIPVIFYSNGETLKKLHDLPDSCILEDNKHVNFGMHYESFQIFWMPLWNYGDYKYALIDDAEETWVELTLEEAKELGKEYHFDVPDQPTLPLMSQIGLKPLALLAAVLFIYRLIPSGKEDNEEGEGETPKE